MRHSPAAVVAAFLLLVSPVSLARSATGDSNHVPMGVYLSWERTAACARHFGIDRWDDACRRLDALEAHNVDTLWVANMSEDDLPRLIEECERRGISLLPAMSSVEARVDWRWNDDDSYYGKVIPHVVELAGKSDSVRGWVLSDEPQKEHLSRVEKLRKRFDKADPERFCTVVAQWPIAPTVPDETGLPVVCVDLYPFFGPDDPNGPHTDASSKRFFRSNVRRLVQATSDTDAVPWVMGQCFSSIRGPRRYDDNWHLVGLPGSYLHWRCPTPAEIRWQVWETLRAGGRGIIIYTLAPEAPDPKTEDLPTPDIVKQNERIKPAAEPTDLGPNALTNPDGSPTPQLEELGRLYAKIARHKDLIRRWKKTPDSPITAEAPAKLQCFTDPRTDNRYAVILNDNLTEKADLILAAEQAVKTIQEITQGRIVWKSSGQSTEEHQAHITLPAGGGAILQVLDLEE